MSETKIVTVTSPLLPDLKEFEKSLRTSGTENGLQITDITTKNLKKLLQIILEFLIFRFLRMELCHLSQLFRQCVLLEKSLQLHTVL